MTSPTRLPDPNRFVRTDAVRGELRRRTVRSGAVSLASRVLLGAVSIASAAVLARLLTPRDFGLLAMASSLTTFVSTFRDVGLPMATVHREDVDHEQVSGLFWINLTISALIALVMAALAPAIAWFYGDHRLIVLTLIVSASTFIGSVGVQHEALLQRQMRFTALTAVEIGSAMTGFALGVAMAVAGAGYWALVGQLVTSHLTRSASLWLACGWRPAVRLSRWPWTDGGLRALVSYGAHHAASRVLAHVGRKLDQVLVGRLAGAAVLGLYSSASRWSQFPFRMINSPLVGVAVAGLSRVQHDSARYRAHARTALEAIFVASLPVLAFVFVESRRVIQVLLGAQWISAAPLFRILCVGAFAVSVTRVTKWLYLSQGTTRRELHWSLIATPLMILAVAIGTHWGATGVAVGYTAGEIALAYPSIQFCLRTSHLTRRDFFAAVARPIAASIGGGVSLFVGGPFLPASGHALFDLALKGILFSVAAVLSWLALPGGRRAARDLAGLARELLPNDRGVAPEVASAPAAPTPTPS
jgi:PST family polysaccharide transporter